MTRTRVAALAIVAALGAGIGSSATAQPVSPLKPQGTSCDISGSERSFGVTYQTSVAVSGPSCTKGIKVMKAFHACRKRNGKSGRCGSPVLGFTCSEQREVVPGVQFTSKVKCKKSGKRVFGTYTQTV